MTIAAFWPLTKACAAGTDRNAEKRRTAIIPNEGAIFLIRE
jgi:hypothetical protein